MHALTPAVATAAIAPPAAAELQGHLLSAVHDLDRLQALLAQACGALLVGFREATARPCRGENDAATLGAAVTALQFEDLATQLLAHTMHRLRHCADRLAADAVPGADSTPMRPNPVTQQHMKPGEIALF